MSGVTGSDHCGCEWYYQQCGDTQWVHHNEPLSWWWNLLPICVGHRSQSLRRRHRDHDFNLSIREWLVFHCVELAFFQYNLLFSCRNYRHVRRQRVRTNNLELHDDRRRWRRGRRFAGCRAEQT